MHYLFRRLQFPVLAVVEDRAFRVQAPHRLRRLLQREQDCAQGSFRLLDSSWTWFVVTIEEEAIIPSLRDIQPPTKQTLIALVNGRVNRAPGEPMYAPRAAKAGTKKVLRVEQGWPGQVSG